MPFVERHKAQAFRVEVELNFANRPVSVLGDDKVGDVLHLRIIRYSQLSLIHKI